MLPNVHTHIPAPRLYSHRPGRFLRHVDTRNDFVGVIFVHTVAMEAETRAWIEAVLGEKLGECSLQEELKDGVVLCNLANALKPGSAVKPSTSKMPFKQMENVASYLAACKELGVRPFEMFMTVDLFENKNMQAVLVNLQSVGRIAQSLPGYTGPAFGAKMATATPREFSESQMAEARGSATFLNQGSRNSYAVPAASCASPRTSCASPRTSCARASVTEATAQVAAVAVTEPPAPVAAEEPPAAPPAAYEDPTPAPAPNRRPSGGICAATPPTIVSQAPGSRSNSFSQPPGSRSNSFSQPAGSPRNSFSAPPPAVPAAAPPMPPPPPPAAAPEVLEVIKPAKSWSETNVTPTKSAGDLEAETRAWIEAVLGEKLGECSLQEELKDGVVLCNLANALKPGSAVKPSTSKMPFKQMENVASYLAACKELGVRPFEMFMTVDLFENKNMQAVLVNLQSVGRIAQSLPGYTGPAFGAKVATANHREFSEDQLRAGRNSLSLTGKGSHGGATQVRSHEDRTESETAMPTSCDPRAESEIAL